MAAPIEMERGISCLECYKKSKKNTAVIDIVYNKIDIFFLNLLIELCKD